MPVNIAFAGGNACWDTLRVRGEMACVHDHTLIGSFYFILVTTDMIYISSWLLICTVHVIIPTDCT